MHACIETAVRAIVVDGVGTTTTTRKSSVGYWSIDSFIRPFVHPFLDWFDSIRFDSIRFDSFCTTLNKQHKQHHTIPYDNLGFDSFGREGSGLFRSDEPDPSRKDASIHAWHDMTWHDMNQSSINQSLKQASNRRIHLSIDQTNVTTAWLWNERTNDPTCSYNATHCTVPYLLRYSLIHIQYHIAWHDMTSHHITSHQ